MKKLWKHLALAGLLAVGAAIGVDAAAPTSVQAGGLESLPQEVQDRGYAIGEAYTRGLDESLVEGPDSSCYVGEVPNDGIAIDDLIPGLAYIDAPRYSFAGTDWKHYEDGTESNLVGYWAITDMARPHTVLNVDEYFMIADINSDALSYQWYDPPIIYIDEAGMATVTSPGTCGIAPDNEFNENFQQVDSPLYVGQVLWDSLQVKDIHFLNYAYYNENPYTSLGDHTILAAVNPHVWYDPKNPDAEKPNWRPRTSWSGDDIPVIVSFEDARYPYLQVGFGGQMGIHLVKADWVQYIDNPHYYNQKSY